MSTATRSAIVAFREAYVTADAPEALTFGLPSARRLRYSMLWAMYENTAYRDIHLWSRKMRADYDLYRYTRGIHNPAFRLGEFYATNVWGGGLDPAAGDGKTTPSAIPIITDNDALRPALALLWKHSNLAQRKAIIPRWGAVMGDVGLRVCVDPWRGTVVLEPVHPATLRDVVRDGMGHVKAYVIEETRVDPRRQNGRLRPTPSEEQPPTVTYTEVVTRDGDDVIYQTYLDGALYDWTGDGAAEWAQPYGFVPLVVQPHLDTGMEWGWSELHAGLAKFREADDIASKLHDQIRKVVDPPWLAAGVEKPATTPVLAPTNPSAAQPTPGRGDYKMLYGPVGATLSPMVAPLDLAAVDARLAALATDLAQDYPELDRAAWDVSSASSGAARREARKRVEQRAHERRAGYDAALVRAQQMAVALGGFHGIPGYEGFGLDSYDAGDLDHSIGERPVFTPDPTDAAEIRQSFWMGVKAARDAGVSLAVALRDAGWSESSVNDAVASEDAQADRPILGYHIEQGIASRNEARASVGLPPTGNDTADEARRQLIARLEVMKAAKDAGLPLVEAAALAGVPYTPQQAPAPMGRPDTPTPGQAPAQETPQ